MYLEDNYCSYKKDIIAPIKEGDDIGKIEYIIAGKKVKTIPIKAAESIKKATYMDYVKKLFNNFLTA